MNKSIIVLTREQTLGIDTTPSVGKMVIGFHTYEANNIHNIPENDTVLSIQNSDGVITPLIGAGATGATGMDGADGADGGNMLRWIYSPSMSPGRFIANNDTITFNNTSADGLLSTDWFELLKQGMDILSNDGMPSALLKIVDSNDPTKFKLLQIESISISSAPATTTLVTSSLLDSIGSSFIANLRYNISWVFIGKTGSIGPTGATGDTGATGATGATGLDAYEKAVEDGFNGTLTDWLNSLIGATGPTGPKGADTDFYYTDTLGAYTMGTNTNIGYHIIDYGSIISNYENDQGMPPNTFNKIPEVSIFHNTNGNKIRCGIKYDFQNMEIRIYSSKNLQGYKFILN